MPNLFLARDFRTAIKREIPVLNRLCLVPASDDGQMVAGRELANVCVNRLALGDVAISEVILDRCQIDAAWYVGTDEERFHFRGKEQPSIAEHGIVEWFLAEPVASQK